MTKNNEVYNVDHQTFGFEAVTAPPRFKEEKQAYESSKAKYEANQKTRTIDKTDSIVDTVIDKFVSRAKFGKTKYGTDLDRQDLSVAEWLDHAIEEHMDAILYLNKLKEIIVGKDGKVQESNK
jgi:hypothetical protein